MQKLIQLTTPLSEKIARSLKAGQRILLNGIIYTARDMAHKRLCNAIARNQSLPFALEGAVIYYLGPTPPRPPRPIGAAGPTTSSRMDTFTPQMLALGLRATIGKGYRGSEVRKALQKHGALHLAATGGAAALLSKHIKSAQIIAYRDLGTEAIRQLELVDFPLVVAYDASGNSVYDKMEVTE